MSAPAVLLFHPHKKRGKRGIGFVALGGTAAALAHVAEGTSPHLD